MADRNTVVVRFNQWYNPVMAERLESQPGLELRTVDRDGPDDGVWPHLAEAHAFQVSSAKDELPRRWFVTEALLARCPNLLVVSSNGAGYDTIDVAACTRAGVLVVNQAGGNARSVAEHTIGLMLDVSRRISENDRRLRSERGFSREDVMGAEMSGKTVGLIGLGHIGSRVARLARAFDMTVLAVDPLLTEDEIRSRGATPVSRDDLLARADFVSLHCPRNADTLGMIDGDAFGRMKAGAIFITTARGGIHSEKALGDALASGHLGGAGIDVWDQEPPPLDHPLLARADVVATFHTAGVTHEARRNMALYAADQIITTLDGERPPRLINPDAWARYATRYEAILGRPVRAATDAA